jgi:hypothetical protein
MKIFNSFVCGNTAVINLRGVSTNKTIICFIAMQTYKELMKIFALNICKRNSIKHYLEIIGIVGKHH